MLLHDGARRDLFGTLAVAARFLRRFFDVFILALFFRTRLSEMFFSGINQSLFDKYSCAAVCGASVLPALNFPSPSTGINWR